MASGTRVLWHEGRPSALTLSRLRVRVRDSSGEREALLDGDRAITIGGDEDNDLVLVDDTVSRKHCRIWREGDRWLIADLGSTNGTFVNRARIREAYLTRDAVVLLGSAEVRVVPIEEEVPIGPSAERRLGGIVGGDRRMREIYTVLEKVAPTDATVVLEGETGTGKDVVARTIHRMSPRASEPMVVFDCGAVAPSLLESELFGHEKGAFTGAVRSRKGVFELADGGTVFLDELGELPLEHQAKLLRAIETREIKRVGGDRPIRVDVRIVAATHRDLEREVQAGRFRSDLFFRVSVVRLRLPPLRERKDDIPLLVKHFLDTCGFNRVAGGGKRVTRVEPAALSRLSAYDWPGNVRELLHVIERAVSFAEGDALVADALPAHLRRGGAATDRSSVAPPAAPVAADAITVPVDGSYRDAKERVVEAFERAFVANLVARHGTNISAAARDADMDRKHLRTLLRRYYPSPEPVEDDQD